MRAWAGVLVLYGGAGVLVWWAYRERAASWLALHLGPVGAGRGSETGRADAVEGSQRRWPGSGGAEGAGVWGER